MVHKNPLNFLVHHSIVVISVLLSVLQVLILLYVNHLPPFSRRVERKASFTAYNKNLKRLENNSAEIFYNEFCNLDNDYLEEKTVYRGFGSDDKPAIVANIRPDFEKFFKN